MKLRGATRSPRSREQVDQDCDRLELKASTAAERALLSALVRALRDGGVVSVAIPGETRVVEHQFRGTLAVSSRSKSCIFEEFL